MMPKNDYYPVFIAKYITNNNDISKSLQTACVHLFNFPGKRFRSGLLEACARLHRHHAEAAAYFGFAIECLHNYSLIHDDLPAMDNAALRRGQPTIHCSYDEATAVLAGDALLTLAFSVLADSPASDSAKIQAIRTLSHAAGIQGMIDGQMRDIENENKTLSLEALKTMHAKKTGALIEAATVLGCLTWEEHYPEEIMIIREFSLSLGLAFQIRDDILDATESEASLGKPANIDAINEKSTFVSLLGLEGAKRELGATLEKAQQSLAKLPQEKTALYSFLKELAIKNLLVIEPLS